MADRRFEGLSRLDRLLAYFAPETAARRVAARNTRLTLLGYEGARRGRREDGWYTPSSSANTEIQGGVGDLLRARAHDLVRNNAYAAKAVNTLVSSRVGTGIMAAPSGPNQRRNKSLTDAWKFFVDHCDYASRTDLYGLQAATERCRTITGETLLRWRLSTPTSRFDTGLRLQVLEPDYLDTLRSTTATGERTVVEGIEYAGDTAIAYWLFPQHPGDQLMTSQQQFVSQRVPAEEVLHVYKRLRPGQLRGVTEFAPVIRRLWDLDSYADAELMRKKIAACAVAAVTTPTQGLGATLNPQGSAANGRATELWNPGTTHYFNPGESINFFDPKPSEGYREYMGVELHAIAAGLSMPYELLTGDLSEVNYSSHRGGLVQYRAMVEADQWQLIVPQLCRPIWERFVRDWELDDTASVPADYTPPRFGLLDPAKETPAMIEAVKGGLMSWQETIRREGYDPVEVMDEYEEWQKDLTDRGVVISSDARTALKVATPASADTTNPSPTEPAPSASSAPSPAAA